MAKFIAHPNLSQEKALDAFLNEQGIVFKKLHNPDLSKDMSMGITQGKKDFKDGRFITAEELKKK